MAEQKSGGCKKKLHVMSTVERTAAVTRGRERKLKRTFKSCGPEFTQRLAESWGMISFYKKLVG